MTSRSPVWHPFTQHAVQPNPTLIARGEGAWLEAADGRRIFDGISSWWVVTHGHRHPRIVQAIKDQVDKLDQVIFAGFTHEPAEKLARHLVAITPPELEYVFFSDSGSTSVEVALKMALGYWRHLGAKRSRILALEGAYHGDTIGGMSVGERGVFNAPYDPLLFDVERIPFPVSGREQATFDALDAACKRGDVAALIVEPLILGAGGMLIYPPAVLAEMKRVCEVHNVLFIADEVMTGWGRTGTLFACEQAGIAPDIACYSKGLTGGSVPLAVTLCRAGIFDAHYSTDRSKTFFHSSSYTANPIACAAALANLEIWQSEPVMDRINSLAAMHKERLARFRGDRRFADVRQIGTIAALDIVAKDAGYLADIGPRLYRGFLARGLLIRPLGNTVYLMPPYSTTASDLDQAYNAIDELAGEVA
ncbi:MAG TPA: adenosylmethionine--8-amino-7-oxononanoate transaminase [Afipia sp.]|nr:MULTISPECIES: adenosylmethionine--8-amino-7-oxononanoate transaminase [unclassified Afipia]MAH71893.1 adenosylmethionine--8-amino-7-oxononanoate aminotransferase BioA [Afipia sp.]OUX58933.1 MAG: adenosylmethionine--8-amino-7-oxononanoate aminotransferase BioA [Afipia sp. TMED4]HAO44109.1 adenosylmethionine--8-amino-7-oxononanoate transaminase [Afipia sp.]HAP48730.1 adenosylmethionine--8-amino-7-oxononanoate transaminase [Afipia sp.]HAQ94993.1 adenosylmethionine--8-amino-7-oxononanoate trans